MTNRNDHTPLIDPDCRDGKCPSCVGAPCEHGCHTPFDNVHRVRVFGGRVVHAVTRNTPPQGSRRAVWFGTTCGSHYVGPNEGHAPLPPDAPVTCRACARRLSEQD